MSKVSLNNRNPEVKKKKVNIVTLGCSKNTVDSEHLGGLLDPEKYAIIHDSNEKADVVVINTCGFIGEAREESVDTILGFAEARKSNEIERLVVMGCLAERYRSELESEIHEVDAFFGANDMKSIAMHLGMDPNAANDVYHYKRNRATSKHYAYLKISEGCDRSCSFCAIPMIRGKHVSTPVDELVREAKQLAAAGTKELVLIAQDLTYYGIDSGGKRKLDQLLHHLCLIDGIEWIRLQYTYPHGFPEQLLDMINSNPKICKYIDIPLQHINSNILKSMKRNVDRDQTIQLIQKIREKVPGIAIRTTMIAGYPGETEEAFQELLDFVREQRFERLGVFAYSPEEGTSAFELNDDVPEDVKHERVATIMELQQEISLQINQQRIGSIEKVLIDRAEGGFYVGRTQFDSPEVDNEVLIPKTGKKLRIGNFYNVSITGADAFDLKAELL